MAGCGGNCQCSAEQQARCGQRSEGPREPSRLAEAIAQIVVDNRLALKALELFEAGNISKEDAITQARVELSLH